MVNKFQSVCTCLKKKLDLHRQRSLNSYSAKSIACMSAWQKKSQNVQLGLLREPSKRSNAFDVVESWRCFLSDITVHQLPSVKPCKEVLDIRVGVRYNIAPSETSILFFMDGTKFSKKEGGPSITVISLACNKLPLSHRFSFCRQAMIYVGEMIYVGTSSSAAA